MNVNLYLIRYPILTHMILGVSLVVLNLYSTFKMSYTMAPEDYTI